MEKHPQNAPGLLDGFANRRSLLKAGLIASSASLLGTGLIAGEWGKRAGRSRFYKFIYDPDQSASAGFAQSARDSGLAVEPVNGDITSLWYNDLYHHWRERPATIAGLTSLAAAYCIEVLARDAGMRTVFRGVHAPTPSGGFDHTLSSVRPIPGLEPGLAADSSWGGPLATALRLSPSMNDGGGRLPIDYAPVLHPTRTTPWVSWLIEPMASV